MIFVYLRYSKLYKINISSILIILFNFVNSTQSPNYANEVKQLPRIRIFYNQANNMRYNRYFRCFPSANARNEKCLLKETIDVQVNRNVERAHYAVIS